MTHETKRLGDRLLSLLPLLNGLVLAAPLTLWGLELADRWAMELSQPTPAAVAEATPGSGRAVARTVVHVKQGTDPTIERDPKVSRADGSIDLPETDGDLALSAPTVEAAPLSDPYLGYGI